MADSKFILGSGEVFTAVDAAQAARMRDMGWQEADDKAIHHAELAKQYSSWAYAPTAAAYGALSMVAPGATAAIGEGLNAIDPQIGKDFADMAEGTQAAHPWASGGGQVGGAVLGAGIAAVTGGASLGLAGGTALAGAQTALMTLDDMALKHIQEPEGSEKVGAALGLSFLVGGAMNVATHGMFKVLGGGALTKVGAAMEANASVKLAQRTPLDNPGVVKALDGAGVYDEVADLAHKYGLLTKSPKQIRTAIKDILKSSTVAMNEAKAVSSEVLSLEEHTTFANEFTAALNGSGMESLGSKIPKTQTVDDLNQLRMKLDSNINGKAPAQKLNQARDILDGYITKVIDHNATVNPALAGAQLSRWQQANVDYYAATSLQEAMQHSETVGKSWLDKSARKLASAGESGAMFSAIAGNPIGIAAGATAWTGGKVLGKFAEAGGVPWVVKGAGKLLQNFDETVVKTVGAGLVKTGVQVHRGTPLATKMLGLSDYDSIATRMQWATENPTKALPEAAQAMEEAGIPGPLIDSAAPQLVRGAQYLNSVRPKSPWVGQTVAPTAWQPTLRQKADYIDKVNAVNNPFHAIENPTPARMEALQAVYPILAQKVALMAAQEAQARPSMTLAGRKWASGVTGQPASPLANAQSRALMATLDAQAVQPQVPQGGPRGGGSNTIAESRLDRMTK